MTPLWKRRKPRRRTPRPPLPEARQEAVVTLPGEQVYPARITRVSDDEVVMVLLLEAGDETQLGIADPAVLEFPSARGMVRIEGRGEVTERDVVRFSLEGIVEVVQRRSFVRVRVVRPIALAPVDDDGRTGPWIDTLTVNVSGSGFLAAGPETLEVDAEVRFRARLVAGDPPIEGIGRITRGTADGQRGIAITELSEEEHRRLVAFIFERERIARRVTRDGEL